MTRPLLLAALMALSFNANAMLSPFTPINVYNQSYKHNDEQRTYKSKVVNPTKAPCKAPCNVCYKDGKQVTCGGSK